MINNQFVVYDQSQHFIMKETCLKLSLICFHSFIYLFIYLFILRVSIPRSTLLPPHKYKAHRRSSFDPSDSLGLPLHCLSGWSNKGQSFQPPPSSLDLGSNLDKKSSDEFFSATKDFCNKVSDHISDVSRLARHKFQHYSPQRKLRDTSCSAN